VVGHTQATSRLTRRHLVGQGVSHRSGRVPLYPIRIEWGKGDGFPPNPLSSPNYYASSLNRGRERAFVPFLRLFSIRYLSSFFFAKCICAAAVPKRDRGKSEGEENSQIYLRVRSEMSSWRPSNVDETVLAAFAKKGLPLPKEVAH